MKLIVGLGNPGKEYEATRHNIGFKVIDAFAHSIGEEVKKRKGSGLIYKGNGFVLAKPETYMNNSGDYVQKLVKFYKIKPEDLLIIYDELQIPVGQAMMKPKGSAGGQNGMKDIIEKLGTSDIQRLKVGIGRAKNGAKNHVLGKFSKLQIMELNKIKDSLVEAVQTFIDKDFQSAMNKLNSK